MPLRLLSAPAELLGQELALVFLTVNGGTTEEESYRVFCDVVAELEKTLNVTAFTVPEDAVFLEPVLREAGLTCPVGPGVVLWFRAGQLMGHVDNASQAGASYLAARTRALIRRSSNDG